MRLSMSISIYAEKPKTSLILIPISFDNRLVKGFLQSSYKEGMDLDLPKRLSEGLTLLFNCSAFLDGVF